MACEMKPKYVFTYFNVKGLGEPIRLMLAYGKADFEDKRIAFKDWPTIKETMPNGQVPVLQIGNKTLCQSLAIMRYLANKFGMNGSNALEAAEIDVAIYTINDLRQKAATLHYESDEALKEARYKTLLADVIPTSLKNLEKLAADNNGYFALNKLTWADIYFTGIVDYLNVICRQDITANNPNLKKIVEEVREIPTIKTWLANAPQTEM